MRDLTLLQERLETLFTRVQKDLNELSSLITEIKENKTHNE